MKTKELEIINYFGTDTQRRKLLEEVYEFLEAYILYDNGQGSIEHLIEEYADIQVILDQIKLKEEITDEEVIEQKIYKVDRTIERIRNGFYK